MENLKEILDPIFKEVDNIEGVAMIGNNGESFYTHGKDIFLYNMNFLKTLIILLQGIAEKLKETPQFFLGEMDNQNIAVIFLENLAFVLLLKGSENLGYLKLQMEELKNKLSDKMDDLNSYVKEQEEEEHFSIPSEDEISSILKKFTYIEG